MTTQSPTQALVPAATRALADTSSPPATGVLPWVEGGWTLRQGRGFSADLSLGQRSSFDGIAVAAVNMAGLLAGFAVLGISFAGRLGLILGGPLAFMAGLGVAGIGHAMRRSWRTARDVRALQQFPVLTADRAIPEGTKVRLQGTVVAARSFASPVTGQPAVLARWQVVNGANVETDEMRGFDFVVRLDDGAQEVSVGVRHAHLIDPPSGRYRSLPGGAEAMRDDTHFTEALVGPGDAVELVGTVTYEVAASGQAVADGGHGRATPMVARIDGTAESPVLIRQLARKPLPGPR